MGGFLKGLVSGLQNNINVAGNNLAGVLNNSISTVATLGNTAANIPSGIIGTTLGGATNLVGGTLSSAGGLVGNTLSGVNPVLQTVGASPALSGIAATLAGAPGLGMGLAGGGTQGQLWDTNNTTNADTKSSQTMIIAGAVGLLLVVFYFLTKKK